MSPARTTEHHRVVIVGSGFSGIGAAIRLKGAGIDDFVILERANDLGGTWRDNSYPGCACDVPSHLYSFSFAPNPGWTRAFSPQPEIWAYLKNVATDHDVVRHIRFEHEMRSATWDDEASQWVLETTQGTMTGDVLIAGTGALSDPAIPDVPGLGTFRGTTFHSATWNHDHDLSGERVAVIGTGASAIQFVPQIQPHVGRLLLFQRTPPWLMPRRDHPYSARQRKLFKRLPLTRLAVRARIFLYFESRVIPFVYRPQLMKIGQKAAVAHLHSAVKDPVLRSKLRPSYALGCKRIILSDDYYPAVTQPNVDVITDGIAEVREHSVVTTDGVEHEVDTIIFGTGFHVTDPPIAGLVRGRDGKSLADVWSTGLEAHLGTTIAGFPNFFMMTGPNTGLGHNSMIRMIESQLTYIIDGLQQMERRGAQMVEVRRGAQTAYNTELQRRMEKTIWITGGCKSWYLDPRNGKNTSLWPGSTIEFRRRLRHFDTADYVLEPTRTTTGMNVPHIPVSAG